MSKFLSLIVLMVFVACAYACSLFHNDPVNTNRDKDLHELRKAALLDTVQRASSKKYAIRPPKVICVQGSDEGMLAELRTSDPRLRPESACESAGESEELPHGGIREAAAGAIGISVSIRDLRIVRENEAEFIGHYYEEELSSGEWRCQVTRRDGIWMVDHCTLLWIS